MEMKVNKHKESGKTDMVAFESAPPYIRKIIDQVLKLERDQLYSKKPRVIDDVEIVVRDAVVRKSRSRETGERRE